MKVAMLGGVCGRWCLQRSPPTALSIWAVSPLLSAFVLACFSLAYSHKRQSEALSQSVDVSELLALLVHCYMLRLTRRSIRVRLYALNLSQPTTSTPLIAPLLPGPLCSHESDWDQYQVEGSSHSMWQYCPWRHSPPEWSVCRLIGTAG